MCRSIQQCFGAGLSVLTSWTRPVSTTSASAAGWKGCGDSFASTRRHCIARHSPCPALSNRCYNSPNVKSLQPSPSFALPAIPFLASSPEADGPAAVKVAAAVFGAPLDMTESFRNGAKHGPSAVRYMSESLESYSPVLDRDHVDLALTDLGDLQF